MANTVTSEESRSNDRRWRRQDIIAVVGVVVGVVVALVTHSCDKKEIKELKRSNTELRESNSSLEASVQTLDKTIAAKNDTITVQRTEIKNLKIREINNSGGTINF